MACSADQSGHTVRLKRCVPSSSPRPIPSGRRRPSSCDRGGVHKRHSICLQTCDVPRVDEDLLDNSLLEMFQARSNTRRKGRRVELVPRLGPNDPMIEQLLLAMDGVL
jgi:hypothetical protein